MVGAFETSIPLLTHWNFKKAESAAMQEAAITNSLILIVNGIEVKTNAVSFKGKCSRPAFSSRLIGLLKDDVRCLNIELTKLFNFHTTWERILKPIPPLGFLTFATPVSILGQGKVGNDFLPKDDDNLISLSCNFQRTGETLSQGIMGLHLCHNCGDEISNERVKALPEVYYCVDCAKLIEKRRK